MIGSSSLPSALERFKAWLKASMWTEGYDGGWRGKCEVINGFLQVSRCRCELGDVPVGIEYDDAVYTSHLVLPDAPVVACQ